MGGGGKGGGGRRGVDEGKSEKERGRGGRGTGMQCLLRGGAWMACLFGRPDGRHTH